MLESFRAPTFECETSRQSSFKIEFEHRRPEALTFFMTAACSILASNMIAGRVPARSRFEVCWFELQIQDTVQNEQM